MSRTICSTGWSWRPPWPACGGWPGLLRRMHIGQVNAYAAYVLLTLLLALVIGVAAL